MGEDAVSGMFWDGGLGTDGFGMLAGDSQEMAPRHLTRGNRSTAETYRLVQTCLHEFVLPTLEDLARHHERLLVITWRDFKEEIKTIIDTDEQPRVVARSDALAPEKDLVDFLEAKLDERGIRNIALTYYQSGKTRATSDFSDCDAVFFIGAFYIPNSAISEYNHVNKTTITVHTYSMAEIIQGIYRTGVRHNKPVAVYFTGDWEPDFVEDCLRYMHATTDSETELTIFDDVEWLGRVLTPAPRSQRIFDLLATKATDLRHRGKAEYTLEATGSGDQRYRDTRRSACRLCKGHFEVSGEGNRLYVERVKLDKNDGAPKTAL
jgi:hypothetical protein